MYVCTYIHCKKDKTKEIKLIDCYRNHITDTASFSSIFVLETILCVLYNATNVIDRRGKTR